MSEIKLNAGQQAAVDAILSGANVFLTGEGGTGKSAAIKRAVGLLRAKARRKTILCAPTGIAARNIHGSTIHSAFRFDLSPKVADALESVEPSKVVHEADTVIIDEIGMVRRDLMDAIALVVEKENEARSAAAEEDGEPRKPLQLVVVGDFSQLPPVVTKKDRPALVEHYGPGSADTGFYAFESDGWKAMGFRTCSLTEPMRQSDPEFVAMLNRARVGDASCLPYFNRLAGRGQAPSEAVSIVGSNKVALEANSARLRDLSGSERLFEAVVKGKFDSNDMAAPSMLVLKEGARVMCVANDRDGRYVNGSTGTVEGFDAVTANGTPGIAVRLDGGAVVEIGANEWENIEYRVVPDANGKKRLEAKVVGTFQQFPLKLAWAVTYHKSQGRTLGAVCIDPSTFAPGQLYVGLSRATSADGVWLTREIAPGDLVADEAVVRFYEGLGWEPPEPASGEEEPDLHPAAAETKAEEPRKPKAAKKITVARYSKEKPTEPGTLSEIQAELHDLLAAGGRTWVRVYELLARVSEERLYKPGYRSFSAWLKAEAKREGVSEGLLWHRKSAGDFYKSWALRNEGAPALEDGDGLSENNLNYVRKIAKVDEGRADELMREMVESGLSTNELRDEWRKVRPAKPAKEGAPAGPGREPVVMRISCSAPADDVVTALRAAGIEATVLGVE